MSSATKTLLSGSTDGRPIAVTATASPGTTIHTANSGTTTWDEVTLEASNIHSAAVTLVLEWGGTSTSDRLSFSIPSGESITLTDRKLLRNGLLIKAYCATTAVVNITGDYLLYTP